MTKIPEEKSSPRVIFRLKLKVVVRSMGRGMAIIPILLIIDKRRAAYIKWGVALIITLINLSVFIIWIPARLQISETFIRINAIWDPIEKVVYLLVDGCLNAYFLYLVHSKLVSAGMTKYRRLFKFNACIVVVSLSMDVLIISMMNLKNSFVYTQFHPLAYIVKLNIELTMASLITKIAKQPGGIYGSSGRLAHSDATKAGQTHHTTSHPHIQSRTDDFFASLHNERGQRPTYKAWSMAHRHKLDLVNPRRGSGELV
ncbi:hypothetical protein H2198_001257 [Neophaeococcomyces mojaviensis]|uniref:Uncharacterized protein n=1 Tax=Neophaeococcomyces mojaviensis TaxID=3383035 RepID=A0ACC3AHE5_9EURO|nr:hypothetical protein H2198_001257 [Knufia sp. JES_112]